MGLCSNVLTIYLPFIEANGISDSMGSAILSVRCLFSFLATFFVEHFYRRLSLRRGILLVSLVGAAAPLTFCIGSAFTYYLGAALAGITYGIGCIYPVSLLLSNWFRSRKGLALGISSAGSGVATMLFSPLLTSVALKYTLRTAFLFHAAFSVVSAVAVFLLIWDTPQEKGLDAYEVKGNSRKETVKPVPAAMSPHILALMAFMMLLNGGAGLAFSGHLSVLARACGYSAEFAAEGVSLFGLTLVLSKLAAGDIADHVGAKKCSALFILIFTTGCFFALGMNSKELFWWLAMVILLGIGASVYNVGPPLWAADLSSGKQYARTLKWLQLFYNLGGIIFTMLPGFIADRTGEYISSYIMFAVMMLVSLFLLLWIYHRQFRKPRALDENKRNKRYLH